MDTIGRRSQDACCVLHGHIFDLGNRAIREQHSNAFAIRHLTPNTVTQILLRNLDALIDIICDDVFDEILCHIDGILHVSTEGRSVQRRNVSLVLVITQIYECPEGIPSLNHHCPTLFPTSF